MRVSNERRLFAALVIAAALPASAQYPLKPHSNDPMRQYKMTRDGATIEEWAWRLRDSRPEIRLGAVRSLGESRDPKAAALLMEAVSDADPRVAAKAVDALGKTGSADATEFLAERLFLAGVSDDLRRHVLVALGEIRDPRASRPILDFVARAADPRTRAAGIFAIGEIGDLAAQPELERIAEEESDPALRKLAREAVEKMTARRMPPTPGPKDADLSPLLRPLEP